MKLNELEPHFITYVENEDGIFHPHIDTLAEAHGIMFLCPVCFLKNDGPVGTHSVICWFGGRVADSVTPGPGRWNPSGTNYDDFSFVGPGAASILLNGDCNAHFFIKEGNIVFA